MTPTDKAIRLPVNVLEDSETLRYAAEELGKYLRMMDERIRPEMRPVDGYRAGDPGITLGRLEAFGLPAPASDAPAFDDAIRVEVAGLRGFIAGSNPRSVLLGVYRFLEAAGCRWVRPGADGEYIPRRDVMTISVTLDEEPSYRHRGVCIEGAVSLENMLENVEWAPKVGLNSYFLEFITPFTFFDRWYHHQHNPYKQPEELTVDMVSRFKDQIELAIKKRSLLYHAVGHGWTCEPLGIPGLGWDPGEYEVSPEVTGLLAEVGGTRGLFRGIPLNTNLCYSNPAARKAIVDYAVRYVQDSGRIDVLHIWMADDANNHCECPNCRDTLPADFLVMLLNEMGEAFTQASLATRIAFIAYLDLLWAPQKARLRHPERFSLLFAPISRTYSRSYDLDTSGITLPPFERNKLKFPANIAENLAHLKEWQKLFAGDSFTYEYYFMWDHYFDPAYYETAKILHADVRKLRKAGLNGIISDQTQRSFFPTGFGMWVLAKTLWDENATFEAMARDYFDAAFGPDGEACRAYMAHLSELFDPPYLRGDKSAIQGEEKDLHVWILAGASADANAEAAARLREIPGVIEAFRPVIERNLRAADACHAKSWAYLAAHADLATLLALAFKARAEGHLEEAQHQWERVADLAWRSEDALQPVFDTFVFSLTLGSRFR